jgi:CDP-glycerol glycerophosphotransferase
MQVGPPVHDLDARIRVFKPYSLRGLYFALTSKVLIDNQALKTFLPLRDEQWFINTWHGGGAYKKCAAIVGVHAGAFRASMERTDLFLSSCARFSQNFLREDFHFPNEILSCGMPRNDILFHPTDAKACEVKQAIGVSVEKKVVLYAPTWRDGMKASGYDLDIDALLASLERRFGGQFVFAFRLHRKLGKTYFRQHSGVINTNHFEDMQELLVATDVLITDYSSCIWDFSILARPCFIFAKDLEKYKRSPGFYTPTAQWPASVAESMDDLIKNILSFDETSHRIAIEAHHRDLGSFETGHASDAVARKVNQLCHESRVNR